MQYFILIYLDLVGTETASIIQLISKGLVGITFLYALPIVYKRSKDEIIIVYFVAIFIIVFNFGIFGENREYIKKLIFPLFVMSLPSFLYVLSIRDFSILKRAMGKMSYTILLLGLFLGISIFLGDSIIGAYSMSLSYYMLLPTLMFLDELLDGFSVKALILVTLSLIVIIFFGSRRPILCIIAFFILKLFRSSGRITSKKIIVNFSLLTISATMLVFYHKIIICLYNILLKFGIKSRTVLLLLQDGVYLSGRDRIYEKVLGEVVDKPILGIGLMGG